MKISKHKHKLPLNDLEYGLNWQLYKKRGWKVRCMASASNTFKRDCWNEAHKIKYRSLAYWWVDQNIPF